jgi:hypothetical protein
MDERLNILVTIAHPRNAIREPVQIAVFIQSLVDCALREVNDCQRRLACHRVPGEYVSGVLLNHSGEYRF